MPADEYNLFTNPGWSIGNAIGGATDAQRPMGSWTGLSALGAPISGAMWGAGIGGLVGGVRELTANDPPEDPYAPPRPRGFLKSRIGRGMLLGALGGTAVGVGSGYAQLHRAVNDAPSDPQEAARLLLRRSGYEMLPSEKQANDRFEVERIVRKDPYMAPQEKERILRALVGADFMQLQRLAAMAAAGALTAAAASKILGLGAVASAVVGGVGAFLARNYFGGPRIFV